MDFKLSEEQALLANSLERYLRENYAFAHRDAVAHSEAGWSSAQWAAFAELGVIGALFGESDGGFGGSGFDIDVVFRSLGAALVVEPFLGALMAGRALAACAQHDLLARAIEGKAVLAFAHEEPQSRYELLNIAARATQSGADWRITGAKAVIPHIAASDHVVVSAKTGDGAEAISLFLVEKNAAGLSVADYPMIDGGRGGELTLDNTPAQLIGPLNGAYPIIESVVAAGIVALCCEAVAIMDALKTATLEYLRTRQQFGAPIGKFQALQHRMATLALEIEQARSAAINAAAHLDDARLPRERAVSSAKYTIGRVGTLVAEEAIQMHGGIGISWELPLSHYAKRLTMIGHQLGDEDHHLERYMRLGRA